LNSSSSGSCPQPFGADPVHSSSVHVIQEVGWHSAAGCHSGCNQCESRSCFAVVCNDYLCPWSLPWVRCESLVLNFSTGVPRPQLQIPSFFHLLCAALFSHHFSVLLQKVFSSLIVCTGPHSHPHPSSRAVLMPSDLLLCFLTLSYWGWCWSNFGGNFNLETFCTFSSFLKSEILQNWYLLIRRFSLLVKIPPFPIVFFFQPADITFCFKTLRNFHDQNMAGAESSRKLSCSNKAGWPGWKIFHRFFFHHLLISTQIRKCSESSNEDRISRNI